MGAGAGGVGDQQGVRQTIIQKNADVIKTAVAKHLRKDVRALTTDDIDCLEDCRIIYDRTQTFNQRWQVETPDTGTKFERMFGLDYHEPLKLEERVAIAHSEHTEFTISTTEVFEQFKASLPKGDATRQKEEKLQEQQRLQAARQVEVERKTQEAEPPPAAAEPPPVAAAAPPLARQTSKRKPDRSLEEEVVARLAEPQAEPPKKEQTEQAPAPSPKKRKQAVTEKIVIPEDLTNILAHYRIDVDKPGDPAVSIASLKEAVALIREKTEKHARDYIHRSRHFLSKSRGSGREDITPAQRARLEKMELEYKPYNHILKVLMAEIIRRGAGYSNYTDEELKKDLSYFKNVSDSGPYEKTFIDITKLLMAELIRRGQGNRKAYPDKELILDLREFRYSSVYNEGPYAKTYTDIFEALKEEAYRRNIDIDKVI